jgi:hypothetical protein
MGIRFKADPLIWSPFYVRTNNRSFLRRGLAGYGCRYQGRFQGRGCIEREFLVLFRRHFCGQRAIGNPIVRRIPVGSATTELV